jgi:hypothetical protein
MLGSGLTRAKSPVFLCYPRSEEDPEPSEHTRLQFSSPGDKEYAEQFRREQDELYRNGSYYSSQPREQHGNAHEGDHQNRDPQYTDSTDSKSPSQGQASPNSGTYPAPTQQPTRRHSSFLWYCHCCDDGPHPSWMPKCTQLTCQHQRCDSCCRSRTYSNPININQS